MKFRLLGWRLDIDAKRVDQAHSQCVLKKPCGAYYIYFAWWVHSSGESGRLNRWKYLTIGWSLCDVVLCEFSLPRYVAAKSVVVKLK